MEQIAAKLASLVPPPPQQRQQPRNELVVEKTGAEKGRETGEARRRPLERSTVEVKGAGGILVLGGLLAAAVVAAGATIIARRAQANRQPVSKKERVEGFNGDHKSKQSPIDGSVSILEENRVSVKSKDNLFEDDTCKELSNGRLSDMDQVNEKICGKVDLGLQNGIGEEISSNNECQKCELREQVEKILDKPGSDVVDETDIDKCGDDLVHEDEEENEVASTYEAEHIVNHHETEHIVNHHETELKEYISALDEEEKEDDPLPKQPQLDFAEADNGQFKTNELIQSADIEISEQECHSVCDRDQKVLEFLEEPKQSQLEMAECKSDVSRAAGPLTFQDMVGQQKVEASQSDLAEEAKSQDICEQQTEQISDDYKREKEDNFEKYEEEIEGKKVPESSPEAAADEEMKEKKEAEASLQQKEGGKEEIEDKKENKSSPEGEEIEEKNEAEASAEGKEHEEEKKDKKDIDTPHEGDEKDEHEEVTEGKKELESSLEGGGDGTGSNQTQPHTIHSEVSTEEFSTAKETDEAIEKRQPVSFAQEVDGSKSNQIQTNIADPEHSTEAQSIVNEVEKMGEERQESDSSPEEAAQMRGDGSGRDRVSSANSNEAEILMHEVETKILSDSLITSSREVKDEVHVNEAEEGIICRDKIPDNLVPAHKAEEKEEQSIIGTEKTTENIMQQQLMAIIREKALTLEKFLMDIPDRLLVGFMVMALTIALLHYTTKALS